MPKPIHALACSLLLCVACSHRSAPSTEASADPGTEPSAAPSTEPSTEAPPAVADAPPRQRDVFSTSSGEVAITPLQHATLLIEFDGKAVYFDPTKDTSYEGLPKAAAIFITDMHPDHLDPAAIESLSTAETVIVAPAAAAEKLPSSQANLRAMKNGDVSASKAMLIPRIPSLGVEAVPMYNKVRGPAPGKLYHDKGRGNGYLLSFGGKRIYVSGDTECIDEMRALKDIDLAFVCMNLPYTMPPSEAAECIAAFHPKVVYPYHYRGSDPTEVSHALQGQAIEVRLRNWY